MAIQSHEWGPIIKNYQRSTVHCTTGTGSLLTFLASASPQRRAPGCCGSWSGGYSVGGAWAGWSDQGSDCRPCVAWSLAWSSCESSCRRWSRRKGGGRPVGPASSLWACEREFYGLLKGERDRKGKPAGGSPEIGKKKLAHHSLLAQPGSSSLSSTRFSTVSFPFVGWNYYC